MPPLASLAASLLVASPPLAACGPPCRFRRRRRKPSLPSAYPQPTLSLPSNPFPSRSRRRRRRGCWRCRALQYANRAPWPARPTHSLVASPPLAACAPTHRVTGEASSEIVGQAAGGGTAGGGSSATVGREGCNGTGPLDSRSMVQIDGDSCIRSGTRAQESCKPESWSTLPSLAVATSTSAPCLSTS